VKVVLDTGVIVSALLFPGGRVTWLRDRWISGSIRPLVSRATVDELIRVLAYPKFKLSGPEIDTVLAAYLPFTQTVEVRSARDEPAMPACDDPDDQEFLYLTLDGEAEALVTGDDDLLRLGDEAPFPILTPAQFKSRVPRRASS
jgi:putative PIN family toxin of toxin-antitoxin system